MGKPTLSIRRRVRWAVAAAVILTFVAIPTAFAAYPASGVTVYTGCLTTSPAAAGQIESVAASPTTPAKPCSPNQVLIHFSGGTITQVTAGPGLAGGGSDGSVTLGLAGSYQLPQGCAVGKIVKWNGGTWQCADEQTYTNGAGLDLTGNTFSVNSNYQLPQSCSAGQIATSGGPTASWGCANQKSYSGADFALSNQSCGSGQFVTGFDSSGIKQCANDQTYSGANFALSNTSCPSGQFMNGVDSNGSPTCASQQSIVRSDAYFNRGSGVISNNAQITVASVSLPAGNYMLFASSVLLNEDSDPQNASCELKNGSTGLEDFGIRIEGDFEGTIPLNQVVSLANASTITLQCATFHGTVFGDLSALRVADINP
jgi:hypothetical protein